MRERFHRGGEAMSVAKKRARDDLIDVGLKVSAMREERE